MKWTQAFIPTLKECPADVEVVSHKLMLRSGFIRQLARGIYDYLPLGLRVLRKIETIVREELNKAGCLEVLLPVVIPGELWQETGPQGVPSFYVVLCSGPKKQQPVSSSS